MSFSDSPIAQLLSPDGATGRGSLHYPFSHFTDKITPDDKITPNDKSELSPIPKGIVTIADQSDHS